MAKAKTSKTDRAEPKRAPITKRTVDAAKPGRSDYVIWDDGGQGTVKGFGLKVSTVGGKVYIYRYRVPVPGVPLRLIPPRKVTIGRHGAFTPEQARIRAKELAALVAQGIDPAEAKSEALAAKAEAKKLAAERARLEGELLFEKRAELWLQAFENEPKKNGAHRRPATIGQARNAVRYMRAMLDGKPLPAITKADLRTVLDAIPARQHALRQQVWAYMSIFFGWALERGDIAENPMEGLSNPPGSAPRDRVLTNDELVDVWKGAEQIRAPLGAFYRLLILTGQRREEVAGMGWGELDRAAAMWTIPASRAKNGKAHLVPLAPIVIDELDRLALAHQIKARADKLDPAAWPKAGPVLTIRRGVAIGGFSQAKALLDAAVTATRDGKALAPWRVHDLRRTLATGLQRLGVRFEVTEAVLNHVSGARGGIAGIYQRHDWADEKRAALEAWARHVAAVLAPAEDTDNVVPIGAATTKLTG